MENDDSEGFDSAEEEVPIEDAPVPPPTEKPTAFAAPKAAVKQKEPKKAAAAPAPEKTEGGKGKAVQIVSIDPETNQFTLNEEALRGVLLGKACANKPAVVVSVAGPFRLGKSFLLNFFLRYLYSDDAEEDWLSDESISIDPELAGFGWAHGCDRDTTGIWMWSKPVMRKTPDGREVAVLLVDTQGTFDNQTTAEVNAMVFALNALISSFQVYNISKRIGEDILQHMHLFTKFGQMVSTKQTSKEVANRPFQRLMFLVRDWGSPKQHYYGNEGGEAHLSEVLNVQDDGDVNQELVEVREDIQACFDKLGCYLLPHPGYEVAEGMGDETGDFTGQISVIRPLFVEKLRDFVPRVLAPENLATKRVLGEEVTCKALFDYIKVYVSEFGKGELPKVSTVFNATAEVNHRNIKEQAKQMFDEEVAKLTGPNAAYRDEDMLKKALEAIKEKTKLFYQDTPKLDCKQVEEEVSKGLDDELEKDYAEALALNDNKAITKLLRTPGTLAGCAFLCTVVGHFVSFIGLTTLASLLAWITWMCFMALAFNLYCKYSGQFTEISEMIDEQAAVVHAHGQKEVMKFLVATYAPKQTGSKKTN